MTTFITSLVLFFFSSRRRLTRSYGDWSSDVCSSDLHEHPVAQDPGVVDENVEPAERVDCVLDKATCAFEVGDVLAVGDRPGAERLDFCNDLLRGRRIRTFARERSAEVVHD